MASSQKSNLIIKLVIVEFVLDKIIIYFSILLKMNTKIVGYFPNNVYLLFLGVDNFSNVYILNISFVFCNYAKVTKMSNVHIANSFNTLGRNSFLSGDLCSFKAIKSFISNCFPLLLGFIPLPLCSFKAFPA